MNFWQQLRKPFFILAPMEDVTDAAFRAVIAQKSKGAGGSYVTFTEFTSADGLVFADAKGQEKLRTKLRFTESERPIVAQLFTATPAHMQIAAKIAAELGFDGIDINMGCPDRAVEKQGAGSALINTPEVAQELIQAAKDGVSDACKNIPVSVKTRLGYNEVAVDTWIPALLEAEPALITVHARTRKEMSKVPAHWEDLKRVVELRDASGKNVLIAGNGDVASVAHGRLMAKTYGVDGIMIGRGMFGNPWAMSEHAPTHKEKMQALIEHTQLFDKELRDIKSFAVMRKHFGSYVEGFPGAKELRMKLMECNSASEVTGVLQAHIVQL